MEIGNVYECITQFELPKWNYGRDEFEDEIILVEKGSVWSLTGQEYMCDGDMRLENDDDLSWIEIDEEFLDKYFKDITKDNNEMGTDEYLRSGY